jgi:hypothetical protein
MRYLPPIAALVAAVMLYGCASGAVNLVSSNESPAASGTVRILSKDQNVRLKINVHHLAPPDRIAPGATVYVVWAQPAQKDANPQNIGVLKLNDNLDGELQTVTPLHDFDMMITPEPNGSVMAPSRSPVLMARINVNR